MPIGNEGDSAKRAKQDAKAKGITVHGVSAKAIRRRTERREKRKGRREGRENARKSRKALREIQQGEHLAAVTLASQQTQGALKSAQDFAAATPNQAAGDPAAQAAQSRALAQMEQWGTGQITDADRAAQQQAQNQAEQMAKGQREAAVQSANARGMGRGGASLSAGLMAGQNAANAGYNAAAGTQNMAQQRALSAIGDAGDLAGNMRSQTASQQQALDQFNQANTQFAVNTGQQVAEQGLNQATYRDNVYNKKKNQIMNAVGGIAGGTGNAMGGV